MVRAGCPWSDATTKSELNLNLNCVPNGYNVIGVRSRPRRPGRTHVTSDRSFECEGGGLLECSRRSPHCRNQQHKKLFFVQCRSPGFLTTHFLPKHCAKKVDGSEGTGTGGEATMKDNKNTKW